EDRDVELDAEGGAVAVATGGRVETAEAARAPARGVAVVGESAERGIVAGARGGHVVPGGGQRQFAGVDQRALLERRLHPGGHVLRLRQGRVEVRAQAAEVGQVLAGDLG